MAATTIFFNGRVISVPGSYSEVDASGLEQVGLGAAGIVAVLGTGEGGRPVSDIDEPKDFIRINKPEKMRSIFRSGDLREVGDMLFAPSKDPDVPGGAVEVVAMKINPATQSAAVMTNAQGDALDLLSRDYGAFTEQINVSVGDGTNKGKLVTIAFEDVTEAKDDLGGDELFKLTYEKPTGGWDTMTAQVVSGGAIECEATRAVAGLATDVLAPVTASKVEILSASGADVGMQVTLYGLDGTAAAKREVLTLDGTNVVEGSQVWGAGDLLGVKIVGTTAGAVTVRIFGAGATIFTVPAGVDPVQGLAKGVAMYVSGTPVTMAPDAAVAADRDVILVGTDASGAVQLEKFTITLAGGTTPVVGLGNFSTITAIVLGDLEVARTLTISAQAAKASPLTQTTLQKAADYFNGRNIPTVGGFTLDLVTAMLLFKLEDLDAMPSAVSILDPANPSFYADLWAIKYWINQNSALISAEYSSGASGGALDNTTAPVFLSGGSEGTPLQDHWQKALNLLKKTRVNTVVVLTPNPAIHAILDAHCAYMSGIGRSERDGVVGVADSITGDVVNKDSVKSAIVDLNTFHLRAVAQAIERYNTAGERQEFGPPFLAAIVAGMQAGSPVGTSLTFKYANVLSFRQSNTWNPTDDAEEMVQAGLCFLESVEGVGRRWVRNVTTHLSSSNIAYTEASVAEAWKYSTFQFRTNMEYAVGKKGFSGTVNAGKSVAINTLGLLVDATILTAYRSLDIELIVDVMEVSVEVAPVIPINFVKNTIHLVTIRQSAA